MVDANFDKRFIHRATVATTADITKLILHKIVDPRSNLP
jgi:hypothetical protein